MTYFGTRLSENISRREPEGYLICLNVPVARTGVQEYLPSELGLPGPDDRLIPVLRPEEEVFSPAYYQHEAANVISIGYLSSCIVDDVDLCVRPALWINLESDIF